MPDADLLIRIAEILETSVSTLLGDRVEASGDTNIVAQKLEHLNALLAEKNRRSRRNWKTIVMTFVSIAVLLLLLLVLNISVFQKYSNPSTTTEQKTKMKEAASVHLDLQR